MITIDINYDMAKELIENLSIFSVDFPFNKFEILCPGGIYLDQQNLRKDVRNELPKNSTFIQENITVDKINNEKYVLKVKEKKNNIDIKLFIDDYPIFVINYNMKNKIIKIAHNNDLSIDLNDQNDKDYLIKQAETSIKLIFSIINTINNNIDHLYINQEKTIRNIKKEGKKSKLISISKSKQNNSVIYINKKNYNKRKAEYKSRRTYTRYKDNWFVRGHYRRYRDKEGNVTKKVWIKSHIRGEEKSAKEIENKRVYKIS
ncbi:MAG: hypothetical protein ACOCP8_06220 [archaeon]